MHHRSRGWLGLALVWAMASTAHGQVRVEDWPKVRMEMVGTDAQGNPLSGLTADAVVVTENKKPVKVDEVKTATEPMSVCVVIDSSGSMYDRRAALLESVNRFIEGLPRDDEYCVADFSWRANIDQELTSNWQRVPKALSYIKSSGGTAMYDALTGISAYMRKNARQKSRAIVLFSDGGDNASQIRQDEFQRQMEEVGTPSVYLVRVPGPSHGSTPGHGDRDDERTARAVTKMFGGFAYLPKNGVDLDASVDHLNQALKSRYVLVYESEDEQKDGRERRVDVELDKVHQKAKDVVRAPEGYYAPLQ